MDQKIGVLNKGRSAYPFWGKRNTSITGLDPLGQQYPSEKIYSQLMPGVTNLTNRIRYYGFYCWLLSEYASARNNMFNLKDQRRFIRRAELTIALIMMRANPKALQIPGSTRAGEILSNSNDAVEIDLRPYTDDNTSSQSYWKASTGAFGQYYVASIRQLGLVEILEDNQQHIYAITDGKGAINGKGLAGYFDENLKKGAKAAFLRVLESGIMHVADMEALYESFNIAYIDQKSSEWKCYIDILTGIDTRNGLEETNYRKESIVMILDMARSGKGFNISDYLKDAFDRGLDKDHDAFSTGFGWYQYQLNEYWQFACGTLFWSVLHFLSDGYNGISKRDELLDEFVNRICKESGIDESATFSGHFMKIDSDVLNNHVEDIRRSVKEKNPDQAGSSAVGMFRMLYTLEPERLKKYRHLLFGKGLHSDHNYVATSGVLYKRKMFDQPAPVFLKNYIDQYILNRHHKVALLKMGSTTLSSAKFSFDGEYIQYIENFGPGFTNPRLDTMRRILVDLGILQESGSDAYRIRHDLQI